MEQLARTAEPVFPFPNTISCPEPMSVATA
jgi:hypothetical protein